MMNIYITKRPLPVWSQSHLAIQPLNGTQNMIYDSKVDQSLKHFKHTKKIQNYNGVNNNSKAYGD